MHNSEIMIREDIKNMDAHRLAYRKDEIKTDIKYAFWHGFISEYKYKKLLQKVQDKYNEICRNITS